MRIDHYSVISHIDNKAFYSRGTDMKLIMLD